MKYGVMTYVEDSDRILMVEKGQRKDDPNSNYYTMPGGKLELNEMKSEWGRLEASIREVKQETGLSVIGSKLRGVILFDNARRNFSDWKKSDDYLVYIFVANSYAGELKESDEGIPRWVDKNLLERIPSNPGDKKMYGWLEDGRNFIGVINHDGEFLDEDRTFVNFLI